MKKIMEPLNKNFNKRRSINVMLSLIHLSFYMEDVDFFMKKFDKLRIYKLEHSFTLREMIKYEVYTKQW